MKKRMPRSIFVVLIQIMALCLLMLPGLAGADEVFENGCDLGQRGWDILQWDPPVSPPDNSHQQMVQDAGAFDGISLQWDYFMVHDDDFTGSFGYVVANPRNNWLTNGLMPTGGSSAIAGKFLSGSNAGTMFADYYRFSPDIQNDCEANDSYDTCYWASATDRSFYGRATSDSDPYHYFGKIELEGDGLRLSGATENFEWDLLFTQDWADRCSAYKAAFPAVTGYDAGGPVPFPFNLLIKNEFWTVDMPWMRMNVIGTITNRVTTEIFNIDGHGYREATWGAWAFNYSGWDFIIVSDEDSLPAGTDVQWSLQTYHDSLPLDYLDVSFYDVVAAGGDGSLKTERFSNESGELGWYHSDWKYDGDETDGARQCLPEDMIIVAKNDNYIVEATVDINDTEDDNQIPMLSDLTPFTKEFTIIIRAAMVDVTIYRNDSGTKGALVAYFSEPKVGGGEFGIPRRQTGTTPLTEAECGVWGGNFTAPLPYGCVDEDGDGYGLTGGIECSIPSVRDCNDFDSEIYPGQIEVIGNGVDDDCDGLIDEGCSTMPGNPTSSTGLLPFFLLLLVPAGFALVVKRKFAMRQD